MKTYDPDDPLLTAYALGELEGAELREIEALLAREPAAREQVEAIRAAASGFGAAFEQEPALAVEPIRPIEIEPTRHRGPIIPFLFYASTAAAACFFFVLLVRLGDPVTLADRESRIAESPLPASRNELKQEAVEKEADELSKLKRMAEPAAEINLVGGKDQSGTASAADTAVTGMPPEGQAVRAAGERSDRDRQSFAAPAAAAAMDKRTSEERPKRREDVLEPSSFKVADDNAAISGMVGKLRDAFAAGNLPNSIDTAALLAELGLQPTLEGSGSELGNIAAQTTLSDSPQPDPEAALVRAVEGFARLVAERTPAADEAWDRVLGDARYASGGDERRHAFVETIEQARAIAAKTAR